MPRITSETCPEELKPYNFHKLVMSGGKNAKDYSAECPFCGSSKFSVNVKTSKFKCWGCDEGGNAFTFLPKLYEQSKEETSNSFYTKTAEEMGLEPETLKEMGVVQHVITGELALAGYNHEVVKGKVRITGFYRSVWIEDANKFRLFPTVNCGTHLFGMGVYEDQKATVDLCEGWKDTAYWYEACKKTDVGGVPRIHDVNVIGIPGANGFKPQWCKFFAGKDVNLLLDNDHPRTHPKTGKPLEQASLQGIRRIASMLMNSSTPPNSVRYLSWWAKDGMSHNPDLPSGMDLEDYLKLPKGYHAKEE